MKLICKKDYTNFASPILKRGLTYELKYDVEYKVYQIIGTGFSIRKPLIKKWFYTFKYGK